MKNLLSLAGMGMFLIILSSLDRIDLQAQSIFLSESKITVTGTVAKISDGDTLHLLLNENTLYEKLLQDNPFRSERIKVRLVGIDTPELHFQTPQGETVSQGYWAEEATKRLEQLLPLGSRVSMVIIGKDQYGRTLGQVIAYGKDINLKMLQLGMAIPYIICGGESCTPEFVQLYPVKSYLQVCHEARIAQRGIFSGNSPLKEMPFEFRLRIQKRSPDKYVGDYQNLVLYDPPEYNRVDLCERLFFLSIEDAHHLGYY